MLNSSIIKQWQMPLHAQWQSLPEQTANTRLNYSSGGALGFINLRGLVDDPAFVEAVASVLACALPTEPKGMVYAQEAAVCWQSPDEWTLICAYGVKDRLLSQLQLALKGVHAQVVDNSGGLMMLRIHGSDAATVLRHLSPYPILSIQKGRCVQTIGKKTPFLLCCIDQGDYALIFRRSFAEYLWKILDKTARPYGFSLQKKWAIEEENWQRYTQP